ncbi:MAG: hypothetical protein LBN18_06710 [Dysgonamonadaceae bacterium]|jgi:hypothetical protein|nr:hypothetical protein [Dysgonamonadaceae bacterium]
MNLQQFHKSFVVKRTALVVTILVFIFSRFLQMTEANQLILWGSTIIEISTALGLLFLSNRFINIRHRTLLPAVFYLLLMGAGASSFENWDICIASVCMLFCLFFLFASYQQVYSQGSALNIALILTVGSFAWPPLLWFFPVFWYGMYQFKSLNFRSFFASLIGFLVVYLFIFTWSVYSNDLSFFWNNLPDWQDLIQIQSFYFTIGEYVLLGYLVILLISSGFNIFISRISEKIKVLKTLSFLYLVCILVFVALFLQPNGKDEWFAIHCMTLSFLVSDLFTVADKKATTWGMFITILFLVTLFFI